MILVVSGSKPVGSEAEPELDASTIALFESLQRTPKNLAAYTVLSIFVHG